MLHIDVSSDIDKAIAEVGNFWRREIPFATSKALTDTAFVVRKHITDVTYAKAFKVRNTVFPGRQWRVTEKATKSKLVAVVDSVRDDGYFERFVTHADGGTRKAYKGKNIAVPVDPEKVRTGTGRVAAAKKPMALKDSFVIGKGKTKLIATRDKRSGKAVVRYVVKPTVKITKTFRFYEDAERVTIDSFPTHWSRAMATAIATSRFTQT